MLFYLDMLGIYSQVCHTISAALLCCVCASTVMEGRLQYLSQGWKTGLSKPEVEKLSGGWRGCFLLLFLPPPCTKMLVGCAHQPKWTNKALLIKSLFVLSF